MHLSDVLIVLCKFTANIGSKDILILILSLFILFNIFNKFLNTSTTYICMFKRFRRKSKDEKISPEMKSLLEEEKKLQKLDPNDDDLQEKLKKIREEHPIKDEEMTPELERLLEQEHKLEFDRTKERDQQLETLVEQIRELADMAVDASIRGDLVEAKIGLDRLEQVRIDTENWPDASNFASRQIDRLKKAIDSN